MLAGQRVFAVKKSDRSVLSKFRSAAHAAVFSKSERPPLPVSLMSGYHVLTKDIEKIGTAHDRYAALQNCTHTSAC